MMASPPELSLDCKPHSYSMLLKSFGDQTDQTQKLEDFLARLEEERLKIDAFKRELPLCMQLLTNAMEASRQQLQTYRMDQGPVLEEFIPMKNSNSELGLEKDSNVSDMASWMTSAQLWSPASDAAKQQQMTILTSPKEREIGFGVSPKLGFDNKQRNGGAFLPFSKEKNSGPSPTLALANSGGEVGEEKKVLEGENGNGGLRRESCVKAGLGEQGQGGNIPADSQANGNGAAAARNQSHRKARRCWSPDLHRRFVNALQMLGGSQVATPKQIRELMKVDGLTNDEVKSHLQKYRLHTRRPSPCPQATGAPTPQLVVLGGIWVPQEYASAAHGGAPQTLYSTHPTTHVPPHYCAPQVPQEFYTAPAAAAHHQLHHHQLHMYHHGSPESDVRGGGDKSESMEEGKSESSSGGENGSGGGERKGLGTLRDEREESKGSEITLTF
ncbi:Myb family transcription factor EFM like [Actinidia chinensis var. chinensis]|uniref:Myb family transcription factor EFM like n=1 Tax=Actinidia chinensis var. chinensis TaxID=1590841 RepID=A0A2R6Q4R9_ACTCC|nr:Myb family transcription factor EFM like [Actinidia chinensis var. chinensis]